MAAANPGDAGAAGASTVEVGGVDYGGSGKAVVGPGGVDQGYMSGTGQYTAGSNKAGGGAGDNYAAAFGLLSNLVQLGANTANAVNQGNRISNASQGAATAAIQGGVNYPPGVTVQNTPPPMTAGTKAAIAGTATVAGVGVVALILKVVSK